MSEETVEVVVRGVRSPVAVPKETRRRTLDERIAIRFPALFRLIASAWSRLPPRSRLRRVTVRRFVRQAIEAANRRDFDLLLIGVDSEVEWKILETGGGFVPPDLLGEHRGHQDFLRVWEAVIEVVDDYRVEYEEVIDLGDRLLVAGRATGHGTTSGVPISQPMFQVITLRGGLIIRLEDYPDRDHALQAAGLSE